MNRFANFDRKERIDNKMRARKVAFMADWEIFATHYIEAYEMALKKK